MLDGRVVVSGPRQRNHPDFSLRGFVRCDVRDRPLTGSWSKGRNGHYAYYHCQRQCRAVNVSKAALEGAFVDELALLQPTPGYTRLVIHPVTRERGAARLFFVKDDDTHPNGVRHILRETRAQRRLKVGTGLGRPVLSDERDANIADHGYDVLRYAVAAREPAPTGKSNRVQGNVLPSAAADEAVEAGNDDSIDAVKKRFGVTPRMQDRLAAAAQLADRLHGGRFVEVCVVHHQLGLRADCLQFSH